MHTETKQLISFAKASGELTEKQKKAILQTAQSLGDDMEEVSVILDAIARNSRYAGPSDTEKLRKCPNCGTPITDVTMKCPECGYVFPQVATNQVSTMLFQQLNSTRSNARKKQIIESFPIPNSKAELLEFLLLSKPYMEGASGSYAKSYLQKYSECIGRCKLFFPDDDDFSVFIQDYERMIAQKQESNKRRKRQLFLSLLVIGFAIAAYYLLPQILSKREENRQEKQYNRQVEQFYSMLEIGNISGAKEALKTLSVSSLSLDFEPLDIIVACLDKEYCQQDPIRADSLLIWAFDLSLDEKIRTREALWEIIQKVADCHMGIGDSDGALDILKIYAKRYPEDWNMIFYRQRSLITMALETGNRSTAQSYLKIAGDMFEGAPEDIKTKAMKELSDMISDAKDFVAFGYGFSPRDSLVMGVDKGSQAELAGVKVGDILVSREVEKQIILRRQRANDGILYHHEFKRRGESYTVDLPYEILPY